MSAPDWNFEPLSPNAEEHGISEWDQFDKEDLGIDEHAAAGGHTELARRPRYLEGADRQSQ